MFPIRDDNPTLRPSVATWGLIIANVVVWILVQGMGSEPALSTSVCELGLIPGELLQRIPPGAQIPLGDGMACVILPEPTWYAPLTSMFLHGSWFHLIGNMWFLHVFGNNVEDVMGRVRFVAFYILCGLAAAAAQVLQSPDSGIPMVGASGAIGGVMGAYVALYPRARIHTYVFLFFLELPAFMMLGYWFLLQLAGSAVPSEGGGVAFWAHVGGFVAGLVLVRIFRDPELLAIHRQMTRLHFR
jgi:membrane associated rhomboid family serine protease